MLNFFSRTNIDKNKLTEISLNDLKKNVDSKKNYYAQLRPKPIDLEGPNNEAWNLDYANKLKKLTHSPSPDIIVYTCNNDYTTVYSHTLKVLPLKYGQNIIIDKIPDNTDIYGSFNQNELSNNKGRGCSRVVTNKYEYENYATSYIFYTDKPPTGGKRSKSRRQKRSAKKSRKHRNSTTFAHTSRIP